MLVSKGLPLLLALLSLAYLPVHSFLPALTATRTPPSSLAATSSSASRDLRLLLSRAPLEKKQALLSELMALRQSRSEDPEPFNSFVDGFLEELDKQPSPPSLVM
jgi:hypothetical protein